MKTFSFRFKLHHIPYYEISPKGEEVTGGLRKLRNGSFTIRTRHQALLEWANLGG